MSESSQPEPTEAFAPGQDPLDAALAAAFGPDSGPPLAAGGSVVQALRASLPEVPRIHLREPSEEVVTPVNLPKSSEMPPPGPPDGRLQLVGEIARGGMGAILKGRDTDLGRDLAVKVLLEPTRARPSWCSASSRRRRSADSCNTLASCRSTSWASCPTGGRTSP